MNSSLLFQELLELFNEIASFDIRLYASF